MLSPLRGWESALPPTRGLRPGLETINRIEVGYVAGEAMRARIREYLEGEEMTAGAELRPPAGLKQPAGL